MRHSLSILALLLIGTPTFAKERHQTEPSVANRADQQAMEREARVACLNGDYARGVALLSDLFVDTKDPNHIFNQGRCYEQNQRFEEAISRFREYLRIGTQDKQMAEKHIAECEALQVKKDAAVKAPVDSPAAPVAAQATTAPTGPVVPAAAVAPAVARTPPTSEPSSAGSGLRTSGIVVAGVGAAALITGVALNLKANSLASSITPPNTFDRGTESTRSHYETLALVSYGVGAAGIVTAAVLYGFGWSHASQSGIALLPTIAPGHSGATLRTSF